jgi:hypothetical protein
MIRISLALMQVLRRSPANGLDALPHAVHRDTRHMTTSHTR